MASYTYFKKESVLNFLKYFFLRTRLNTLDAFALYLLFNRHEGSFSRYVLLNERVQIFVKNLASRHKKIFSHTQCTIPDESAIAPRQQLIGMNIATSNPSLVDDPRGR